MSHMSLYCNSNAQNCYTNCCNSAGYCPSSTASCYYYYNSNSAVAAAVSAALGTPAIIGIAVGGVVFLILMAICICCCCRRMKRKAEALLAVSAATSMMNSPMPYAEMQMMPMNTQMNHMNMQPGYYQPIVIPAAALESNIRMNNNMNNALLSDLTTPYDQAKPRDQL